jgi:hypothetical protein
MSLTTKPSPDPCQRVATYPYHAQDGTLVCEVWRYFPKRFEIVDAEGKTLADFPEEVPLYRLPDLQLAPLGETVWLAEGEKDVDTLRGLGLVATCNPGGTRRGWRALYSEALANRHVAILPDADGPGQRHAAEVAAALQGSAASVTVLPLPGLHGGDDVTDWLGRGHTALQLRDLLTRTRCARAGLIRSPHGPEKMALIFGSSLDSSSKLVLLALNHHARKADGARHVNVAETSAPELARMTGLHRVTAQRLLASLRDRGVLRRNEGGRGHVIVWDVLAALAREPLPS